MLLKCLVDDLGFHLFDGGRARKMLEKYMFEQGELDNMQKGYERSKL